MNKPALMEMIRPATDQAIDEHLHRTDTKRYHRRFPEGQCPLCPSTHELRYQEIRDGINLEPWQEDLAERMLAEAPASPALQAYLAERELVADEAPQAEWVEVQRDPNDGAHDEQFAMADRIDYSSMTAKQLRPIASAAGMKGARVAKKSDMVEFLETQ